MNNSCTGLSTARALEVLYEEIDDAVSELKQNLDLKSSLLSLLRFSHHLLLFQWLGYLILLIVAVCMASIGHVLYAVALGFSVFGHIFGGIYVALRFRYELYGYLQDVMGKLAILQTSHFSYESLWQPVSPCISLQWTQRDGRLVNCPTQLVVRGDVIRMRPGQEAPGRCRLLDYRHGEVILEAGHKYSPKKKVVVGMIDSCHVLIEGVPSQDFVMLETPFISYLRLCLNRTMQPTRLNNFTRQQKIFMDLYIKRCLVPLVGLMSLLFYAVDCCRRSQFNMTYVGLALTPVTFLLACPMCWFIQCALGTGKVIYSADNTLSKIDNDSLGLQKVSWTGVIRKIFDNPIRFWHSGSFLEVFASVTNICCVDKKGILSWPNAVPEKVFFLKQVNSEHEIEPEDRQKPHALISKAEVLDLTLRGSSNSIMFDDPKWTLFLENLKPLGLAVLLNSCDEKTYAKYASFFDHICFESQDHDTWVPVASKRCLCDLSYQIGFTPEASLCYEQLQHLYMFRHDEFDQNHHNPEMPRLKMPFPHFSSTIVRDKVTGTMQMFSQGTADLILDHCTDYWDGQNICSLTDAERKSIQDFYQRTSLTAYCIAFSYTPLESCADLVVPPNTYVQVPGQRTFSSGAQCPEKLTAVSHGDLEDLMHSIQLCSKTFHNRFCKQIFIGMVTLQYQARPAFVKLIEDLEKACIRFVHFSKENELRSRGFSEKMGLESGWNCHISLLTSSYNSSEQEEPLGKSVEINMQYNREGTRWVSTPSIISPNNGSTKNTRQSFKISLSSSPKDADTVSQISTAVHFDITNRAKLPKGIENMRAHIENVDNVPLLVSLFTDCTPVACEEMLRIMQEYKQVVCVLGSSRNIENLQLFIRADCSISWVPQAPYACSTSNSDNDGDGSHNTLLEENILLNVVSALNSIPCVVQIGASGTDELSVFSMVKIARHFVSQMQASFQFSCLCASTLSLLHLCCHALRLPLPLSPLATLHLVVFVVPIIALTLVCSPTDPDIMAVPNVDSLQVNIDTRLFCVLSYILKASFTVITLVLCKVLSIVKKYCTEACHPGDILDELRHTESNMVALKLFNLLLVCVHFVAASASGLNRKKLLWQHNPFLNFVWLRVCFALLLGHTIPLGFIILSGDASSHGFSEISAVSWLVLAISPIALVILSESCKHHELTLIRRQEKRLRLHFMTKLGMNSPF